MSGSSLKSTAKLFVDTNVWKCLTYSKATLGYAAKAKAYADFVGSCVAARVDLFSSILSYSELASIIERTECDIYNAAHGERILIKKFREGIVARQEVVEELAVAWGQVEALSTLLPITLDSAMLEGAKRNFSNYPLDGYDVFFVEQMKAAGISAIVTDDLDYIYVPGLHVYTCNNDSIGRAKLYKRLA